MSRLLSLCAACCVLCSVSAGQPLRNRILAGATDDGEFPIDTSGTHEEHVPVAAFDGNNILVVWEDWRRTLNHDVYGCRVTPQGVGLDPQGIPVSTAEHGQTHPAASFDGANSLVVWADERSNIKDIYGARVTPDGAVLDPQGIPISTAVSSQEYPAVSFDGTHSLVVWADERSGGDPNIYGARVTLAGSVLEPQGIGISRSAYGQYVPAVSSDGADFLVVWEDRRHGSDDIYGARVTGGGTVLDPKASPSLQQRARSGGLPFRSTARTSSWCGRTLAAPAMTSTERG